MHHHETFDRVALVGHIVPGILFMLWGMLWLGRARHDRGPFGSMREVVAVCAVVAAGVVLELGWRGWDGWVLSDRSVMNYQHVTMYIAFAIPSLMNVLAGRGRVSERVVYVTLTAAFFIAGMLFVAHGNPNAVSEALHVLMGLIFFAAGIVTALEARGPRTAALGVGRSWLTISVGLWFLVCAWVLGASGYDFNSVAVILRVRLFFVWDLGLTGLIIALLPRSRFAHGAQLDRVAISRHSKEAA